MGVTSCQQFKTAPGELLKGMSCDKVLIKRYIYSKTGLALHLIPGLNSSRDHAL